MTSGVGDTGPRLAPLPRERWDDDTRAALRRAFPEAVVERFFSTEADAASVPTVLTTLIHHPALAGPWLEFNNVLLRKPTIDHRLRELMVLRVAWQTRSYYEWAQHVLLAPRFDISADDIAAIAQGEEGAAWTPLERALVAATDQLITRQCVDDETWARLAEGLDPRQLVEVVFVVGTYTCLAMAFNSFGLQLEAGVDTSTVPPLPN